MSVYKLSVRQVIAAVGVLVVSVVAIGSSLALAINSHDNQFLLGYSLGLGIGGIAFLMVLVILLLVKGRTGKFSI